LKLSLVSQILNNVNLYLAGGISNDIYYFSSMTATGTNPTVIRRMDFKAKDVWAKEYKV